MAGSHKGVLPGTARNNQQRVGKKDRREDRQCSPRPQDISIQYWCGMGEESKTCFAVDTDGSIYAFVPGYAPELLAEDAMVDRLSLFLSFSNATDERVQSAAKSLLEDMSW